MKIQWKIEKKRGNYRPTLNYMISLEEHEKALAMHAVSIRSLIPRVVDSSQAWCMPGTNERAPGWQPTEFHRLSVPYFKNGTAEGFIRLPFKESGYYPEVEGSFAMLRDAYEKVVRQAYRWHPVHEKGELDITPETREQIAASVTAQKMLVNGYSPSS